MDKPEDISQWAWEKARKPTLMLMGGVSAQSEAVLDQVQGFYQRIVARAILSAQSQAYIDAARIAAEEYLWDEHELAQATDVGRAPHHQAEEISAAILSRKDEIGR